MLCQKGCLIDDEVDPKSGYAPDLQCHSRYSTSYTSLVCAHPAPPPQANLIKSQPGSTYFPQQPNYNFSRQPPLLRLSPFHPLINLHTMTYSASASEAQRKRYSAELAAYTLRQFNAARASTDDAQREEGSRTSSPSSSPSRKSAQLS